MKHEQWRDIANFNGNYKVSNFGRVQSVERTEIVENKRTRKRNGRILKHGRHPNGYHYVNLCLNGQCNPHYVHRLVAAAFVGDPTGVTVNHSYAARGPPASAGGGIAAPPCRVVWYSVCMKCTYVFLPEPLIERLEQRARETGLSRAELIRRAVDEYLNKTR